MRIFSLTIDEDASKAYIQVLHNDWDTIYISHITEKSKTQHGTSYNWNKLKLTTSGN